MHYLADQIERRFPSVKDWSQSAKIVHDAKRCMWDMFVVSGSGYALYCCAMSNRGDDLICELWFAVGGRVCVACARSPSVRDWSQSAKIVHDAKRSMWGMFALSGSGFAFLCSVMPNRATLWLALRMICVCVRACLCGLRSLPASLKDRSQSAKIVHDAKRRM